MQRGLCEALSRCHVVRFSDSLYSDEKVSINLIRHWLSPHCVQELDVLTFGESDGKISERNKRTIGILRELFPELSKVSIIETH
jgi:hypothetical protein